MLLVADRLRHSRRRPRRLERLERRVAAHALTGRPRSCSAAAIPSIDRKRARRQATAGIARRIAGLVRSRIRRLCRTPLSGLLAEGRPAAQDPARQAAARHGGGDALAGDGGVRPTPFAASPNSRSIAPDHPRLLSIIAGACAAAGANIVDAQIFTTTDGLALDTIFDLARLRARRGRNAARPAHRPDRSRRRCAARSASPRWSPPKHAARMRARRPSRSAGGGDRQQSVAAATRVIEVSGLDRPGLLCDLTATLSQPQPQHRLGPYRHLRRKGGGRLLCHAI